MTPEPDWNTWTPQIRATLLFVCRNGDEVLLIRKKRGIGAGKINGPGGKIDPGETPADCSLRETREETGIIATDPEKMGELFFQFTDGLSIHCEVFLSESFTGTMIETEEAIPFWCKFHDIPYDEMWQDDIHWLPTVLSERKKFTGYFVFDGDTMLTCRLEP